MIERPQQGVTGIRGFSAIRVISLVNFFAHSIICDRQIFLTPCQNRAGAAFKEKK